MDELGMSIDASQAIEIEASRTKLLGAGAAMVILATASTYGAFYSPSVPHGSRIEFVCYVGVVMFPALALIALWRAFTSNGPVITITRDGIRDSRIATEVIPWSAINDISVWQYRRQRFMVLKVSAEAEARLSLTRMARWSRGGNAALGADGFHVGVSDLKIRFDDLLATTLAYARAWQARAGMTRTYACDR